MSFINNSPRFARRSIAFKNMQFPRTVGKGALPLKPRKSEEIRGKERTELLTFSSLSPADIDRCTQLMEFERLLNNAYEDIVGANNIEPWVLTNREMFEEFPPYVMSQVLASAMVRNGEPRASLLTEHVAKRLTQIYLFTDELPRNSPHLPPEHRLAAFGGAQPHRKGQGRAEHLEACELCQAQSSVQRLEDISEVSEEGGGVTGISDHQITTTKTPHPHPTPPHHNPILYTGSTPPPEPSTPPPPASKFPPPS